MYLLIFGSTHMYTRPELIRWHTCRRWRDDRSPSPRGRENARDVGTRPHAMNLRSLPEVGWWRPPPLHLRRCPVRPPRARHADSLDGLGQVGVTSCSCFAVSRVAQLARTVAGGQTVRAPWSLEGRGVFQKKGSGSAKSPNAHGRQTDSRAF